MEQRPFTDKSVQPDQQLLKNTLGLAYKFYVELDNITTSFKKEWNYSKSGGWMQKVHDGKKALYYFIPLKGAFMLSLAIREQEKDDFLSMQSLAVLHDELNTAKKYSEGYALKFHVVDAASFSTCLLLIRSLAKKERVKPWPASVHHTGLFLRYSATVHHHPVICGNTVKIRTHR